MSAEPDATRCSRGNSDALFLREGTQLPNSPKGYSRHSGHCPVPARRRRLHSFFLSRGLRFQVWAERVELPVVAYRYSPTRVSLLYKTEKKTVDYSEMSRRFSNLQYVSIGILFGTCVFLWARKLNLTGSAGKPISRHSEFSDDLPASHLRQVS